MNKPNLKSSLGPTNSNQSVYSSSSSKTKKVTKNRCGCGKRKKRS